MFDRPRFVTLCLLPCIVPLTTALGSPPETIVVSGTARDFWEAHADFQAMPSQGYGVYAGLLEQRLDAAAGPVLVGLGNRIVTHAEDSLGQQIAPHMVNMGCSGGGTPLPPMLADGRIRCRNTSVFDGYDSSLGAYGGGNIQPGIVATNSIAADMIVVGNSSTLDGDAYIGPSGDPAVVVDIQGTMTGVVHVLDATFPLPVVTEPAGLPVYPGGELLVPMNSSVTISDSWHINGEFDIKRGATVTIDGKLTMLCEDRWLIGKDATVIIPDGSSLTIYCRTQARLYGTGTVVNPDTSDPGKLMIHMLGNDLWNDQIVMNGAGTQLCAKVTARDNLIDLDQSAEFFGTFAGNTVEINNQSRVHVDCRDYGAGGLASDPGYGDVAAALDPIPCDGGITSNVTFDQWFNDVPGENLSIGVPLTFVLQPDGETYLFDDQLDPEYGSLNGFYPLDGRLFGNEGYSHNNHFTYMLGVSFTYDASAAQFVELVTDSDAWLFVDGQQVIDLGGVHAENDQRIDLDRLCLDDGGMYWMWFLVADRSAPSSRLRIETNVVFEGSSLPTVTAAFD